MAWKFPGDFKIKLVLDRNSHQIPTHEKFVFILFAVAAFIVCSLNLNALEVGDKAPSFELLDDQGNTWKSESFRGKKLLLVYFYPAAMTGGCTKQARAFRDDRAKWREKNVEIVGISGDQPGGACFVQTSREA